jgi:glycosyltransferase involved in cell wall biosynthesis
MRRALFVSASAKPGGAERSAATLARLLPEHGWELVPVLLEDGPFREWLDEPVLLRAGRTRRLHRTALTTLRLARLAHGTDAVLSSQSRSHVYGGLAAKLARVPAIWWQHGIADDSREDRAAARVPAAAVVCASGTSADAQRLLTPRARVAVVPECAPTPVVPAGARAELRRRLGWDDAEVVGIVGRLERWKGQELFLEAAALIAERRPQARFLVVGGAVLGWEGDYPARLEALAAELGIAERVHFAGHQADVAPWWAALDVAVHASTSEPFGLVLLEAMALSKPLVTVSAGAALELVEDGVSGLVAARNADALAGAVLRILDDPGLAARLAIGGVGRSAAFSPERAAAEFASVLDSVVPAQPRAAARVATERSTP